MKLILTNNSVHATPIMSSQDGGFADALLPDVAYVLDRPNTTVLIVGDKPDFIEELKEGFSVLFDFIKRLVTQWRTRPDQQEDAPVDAVVNIMIDNQGVNAVRVILGNNVNDLELQPGHSYAAVSPEYVEIRELGV